MPSKKLNAQLISAYLEKENILILEQADFRQYRSTDNQTTHFAQVIEDSFQDQKVALETFIDLQKAFDKIWKDGVAVNFLRSGKRGRMSRWTKSYMHKRRARVLVDGRQGNKCLLHLGVPQGRGAFTIPIYSDHQRHCEGLANEGESSTLY